MEQSNNQRLHPNTYQHTSRIPALLHRDNNSRKQFHTIFKPILNKPIFKIAPVAVLSSAFLGSSFASASTWDAIARKKGILTHDYSGNEETTFLGLGEIIKNISAAIDWLKEIKTHIYEFSIDVFAFVFEMLMVVGLQTPSFIFNNSFTMSTTQIFSIISITIIILLTIFESLVQMGSKVTKQQYTKFTDIMKRLPIAVGVAGFAPFLFEFCFKMINKLTRGISKIGGDILSGSSLKEIVSLSGVDVLGMLLFDFVALGLLIPILLQSGRRWWDLFTLSAVSPLAFTAWIFDRHRHLHSQWWNTIKRLSMVQLVFATFITLMGVFLYSARFISADMWVYKILIILGGLYRIANPPQFVKAYSRGEDTTGVFDAYTKTFKGVYDTVTFKKFAPLNYYRKQKGMNLQRNVLRAKHGKRFVDDLIRGK